MNLAAGQGVKLDSIVELTFTTTANYTINALVELYRDGSSLAGVTYEETDTGLGARTTRTVVPINHLDESAGEGTHTYELRVTPTITNAGPFTVTANRRTLISTSYALMP